MGYEWACSFEGVETIADLILEGLAKDPEHQVIEAASGILRFRFKNTPLRPHWPDDVHLSSDGRSLVITFHTYPERAADLLGKVEKFAKAMGGRCSCESL